MLCDSIKVKDPMKVGRFGLGFKSVFHVTGGITIIPQLMMLYLKQAEVEWIITLLMQKFITVYYSIDQSTIT